ncbi:hypothetical protein KC19_1G207900 [Ceratodon purpureus]|uniref:Uncharacterized protein n=1 Tax=Ceratodon purpureus TaxID=3225 RepID=A0A8T0J7I5_CERPU|nr:hypothetical protein KC19_1G207900 [Ceratodon purpureus]
MVLRQLHLNELPSPETDTSDRSSRGERQLGYLSRKQMTLLPSQFIFRSQDL